MAAFAQWLAQSQFRRVVIMVALFPLPFLGLISSAVVAMTAQLKGWQKALPEVLIGLVLLAGLGWIAGLEYMAVVLAAGNWLLVLVLGGIVGVTRSITLAVQVAVILALAGLIAIWLVLGDPVTFWTPLLEQMYADLAGDGLDIEVDIAAQASIAGAALITGVFIGALVGLLLGSRWASIVVPQPEVQPFAELRLGYALGGLAAIAGIGTLLSVPTGGALLILGTAFMFQGMAVVAWWSQLKMWPGGWWLGAFAATLILPNLFFMVTMLLATIGFIDNWYGLRRTSIKL